MEFEFVLPQRHEDLLDQTGINYCVAKVLSKSECETQIKVVRDAFKRQGVNFIFDYFDVFYSIVENAQKLQLETIFRATDLLFKAVDTFGIDLTEFLANPASERERSTKLNTLKMLVYVTVSLIKKVDSEVIVVSCKKQKTQSNESEKWNHERYKAMVQLFNVLQLPLSNLWDPPVAEEAFVNLCAEFAYRTIEHPTIKQKNVADTVFQILGLLLKTYNHSIVFPTKIFELMKSSEMSAMAIANGVVILFEQYGIRTVLKVIIDQVLLNLESSSSDAPIIKNIASFFTELGNLAPTMVMPFLREIAHDVLALEPYQLRICILQLMTEIVMSELTGEQLSQDEKDIRDEYLEHLFGHMHDVNAHVRSKALFLWSRLKDENAIPLSWLSPVVKIAVGRLEDKSNLVRKNAIQLIKCFLARNPFAAKLSLEELETRYNSKLKELSDVRAKMAEESSKNEEVDEKWNEILLEMHSFILKSVSRESIEDERIRPEDCENLYQNFPKMLEEKDYERLTVLARKAEELNGNWETIKKMDSNTAFLYFATLLRSYYLLQNSCKSYEDEYKTTENAVRFLEDSLTFSRIIVNAVSKLQELLLSKVESDMTEAIDFFTSAYQFGIKNTESGMRQLLFLVWSVSKEKRGPVQDAYKVILFDTNHEGRAHSVKAVFNLMRFVEKLSYSQFIAFEELVKDFVHSGDITTSMIQTMFEIYTKKLDNISNNDSRLALQLLVICSNAKPSIAKANADLLEEICFVRGDGKRDSRVLTLTLDFCMNVNLAKDSEDFSRLEADDKRVVNVVEIFKKYFLHEKSQCFDEVCGKTFQYIYTMCHLPNIISQDIVKTIWRELVAISLTLKESAPASSETLPTQSQVSSGRYSQIEMGSDAIMRIPVTLASRFIFMIGYVAMKELIYLDVDVFSNLKYRQDLTEVKKNKKKATTDVRPSLLNQSSAMAVKRKSAMPGVVEDDENNDDDVVGLSHDDMFADQINAICEKEMLFHKDSIFQKFIPMIVDILKHPSKFNHPDLQRSALLTLVHLMSVSSEFCDKNMQFLMNIFTHAQDIDIKNNVMIGMSDLTFRFPNVIEPWSTHMYSTLQAENQDLRLTSVRILAHLISHEMILIKGQISDLAICLVDTDSKVRQTTEVFFKEIANKSNILYNVLPDIVSRLSDPKLKLEEGKYQTIMKYIIGLISKDRQIEGLVEKLCYRFKVTELERQWRDIGYCLSLLSYTEKTIKKLVDNIVLFKDKVQVKEVYDCFKQIISNTSKLAKPELKAAVQDFEMKLEDCFTIDDNLSRENAENRQPAPRKIVPANVQRAGRSKPAKKQLRTSRRGQPSDSSSDEGMENQPPTRQKVQRNRRVVESDSDEEPAVQKRAVVTRHTKTILEQTSSDESSKKKPSKRGKRR